MTAGTRPQSATPGDKVYWTAPEAAADLGISLQTLYNEKAAGKIAFVQRAPGCKLRFLRSHLDDYARGVDPLADELARRRAAGGRG